MGSDGEVEAAPEVEAPAPSEPMDLMSALQMVLKKALAHNQLARGLHEGCKAIERGDCQLVILAKDCNQNDYKKLVEALAREHKVVKCSMAVVKDYGEDSEGLNILMEHLKANK